MVCTLKLESNLGQEVRHLIAKIGEVITGGDREITALQRNFISQIPAFFGASCVPVGLVGVKGVEGRLRTHLERLISEWVDDGKNDDECLSGAERVDKSRGNIWDQLHI